MFPQVSWCFRFLNTSPSIPWTGNAYSPLGKRNAALDAKSKWQSQISSDEEVDEEGGSDNDVDWHSQIEEISSDEDEEEEAGSDCDVEPTLHPLSDDDKHCNSTS